MEVIGIDIVAEMIVDKVVTDTADMDYYDTLLHYDYDYIHVHVHVHLNTEVDVIWKVGDDIVEYDDVDAGVLLESYKVLHSSYVDYSCIDYVPKSLQSW